MISRRPDRRYPIRFGTRGSALAIAQTELAIVRFREVYPEIEAEIRVVSTEGDRDKQSPLTEIGGRGVFTNAIESAVMSGEVDAAVHSAKDLPTALHHEAPLVAFPNRADPRDVLVSRHGTTLDRLPRNPVIGTSSRRRAVQIARLRPDARIASLRGNIDTRLRKAAGEEFDAIVLAGAGLQRMGWGDRVSQSFSVEEITPAPAQGAIAIQARHGSHEAALLGRIDDASVSIPVGIERAFLGAIGAGCAFPVGAYAAATSDGYRLIAMLSDESGDRMTYAEELLSTGEACAHAAEIAARLRSEIEPGWRARSWNGTSVGGCELHGVRVVVTRPRRQARPLIAALRERGAEPILLPTIRVEPIADTTAIDAELSEAERGAFDWIVFTSANAVEVCAARMAALRLRNGGLAALSVAAVGPATAAAAEAAGLPVRLVPETTTAEGLAAVMMRNTAPGAKVLFPRSAIGRDALPRALREAGMDVVAVAVYRTLPEEHIDPDVLERVRRREIDLIVFASPSSVRNFLALPGLNGIAVTQVPVVCAGSVTASAAKEAGFAVVAMGIDSGAEATADAISDLWRTRTRGRGASNEPRPTVVAPGAGPMGRSVE